MSKLSDLIKEKCPNGVKFVELGKVCEITKGRGLSKSDKGTGDSPIILYGELYTTYGNYIDEVVSFASDAAKSSLEIRKNDLLLPVSSTTKEAQIGKASVYRVDDVCYLGGDAIRLRHQQNASFLMYVINSADFEKKKMKCVSGTTINHLNPGKLAQIKIPIPPLEVQNEIVHILDNFAELTAELTAELSNRKKQYEYYRDLLLNFDENTERERVKWLTLEDVFEFRNGYTPSKANKQFWTNGTISWYRMEDIRQNGRILKDSIQHVTTEAIKGKGLFKKDSIIMATTATIGEHAMLTADSLANQQFTNFAIREPLKGRVLPKFAFYYFFIIDKWCISNVNISSFASVEMNRLKKVRFPIPPVAEQERIIKILDRFDKLTSDISEGLPAEIEARQNQYEYYRDKLLTFEEFTVNV